MGIFLRLKSEKSLTKKRNKLNRGASKLSERAFDRRCRKIDSLNDELNRRSWKRYHREKKKNKSSQSYGVRREHGWYLPNDD